MLEDHCNSIALQDEVLLFPAGAIKRDHKRFTRGCFGGHGWLENKGVTLDKHGWHKNGGSDVA
eukprot:2144090-Amphidinium_carterae.1